MGLGLLGAMGGLGEAGVKVGEQMQKSAMQMDLDEHKLALLAKERESVEKIKEAKDKARRDLFVGEMDSMRTAKLGENAGNLDQAAETYRTADGLTDADREAGLQGVTQARTRLGKLTPEEVGMAGLKTGNLEAKDYINATSKSESTTDRLANAVLLKQLGIDATAKNIEAKEEGKNARLDKAIASREDIAADKIESTEKIATTKGGLSPSQQLQNREIDVARRIVASLSPAEIKKKTAKFTNTGRDNPDYDAGLANRVRIAAKRRYGEDDWFDSQGVEQETTTPAIAAPGVGERFAADTSMQGFKLGKQTDKGTEVFNSSGKLVGHYR